MPSTCSLSNIPKVCCVPLEYYVVFVYAFRIPSSTLDKVKNQYNTDRVHRANIIRLSLSPAKKNDVVMNSLILIYVC